MGFTGARSAAPELRCVEWATGRVRWTQEGLGAGSVALAGDRLVVLLETGELVIARAEPEAYVPLARSQILGRVARAPFALADRRALRPRFAAMGGGRSSIDRK